MLLILVLQIILNIEAFAKHKSSIFSNLFANK